MQTARDRLARELRSSLAPLIAGQGPAEHQAAISAGLQAAHAGEWIKKTSSGSIKKTRSSKLESTENTETGKPRPTPTSKSLDVQASAAEAAMRRRLAYARRKCPRSLQPVLDKSLHPKIRPHALLAESELLDRAAALEAKAKADRTRMAKGAAVSRDLAADGEDAEQDEAEEDGGGGGEGDELEAELEAMLMQDAAEAEAASAQSGSGTSKRKKVAGSGASAVKPPLPWQASVALRSLVVVETRIVAPIEGTSSASSGNGLAAALGLGSDGLEMVTTGTGIVVSRELGLVLVSRALCPVLLCQCSIRMHTTRIAARPVFLSPTAGFALLHFDTSALKWKERGLCLPPNPAIPALARRDGSLTS